MRIIHHSRQNHTLTALIASVIWLCVWPVASSAQTLPEIPMPRMERFSEEIREHVRKAFASLEANPRDPEITGRLCMTLQTYEMYELASTCYTRARSLAPEDFRWIYYSAVTQAALGDHAEAAKAFRVAVDRRGDFLPAQLRLADSLFATGHMEESGRFYQSVIATNPAIPQAHYGMGRVAAGQGELSDAVRHFRQAVALFPEYGMAHYALGMAHRDLGETDSAKEELVLYQKYRLSRPPLDDALLIAIAEMNTAGAEILKRGAMLERAGRVAESIAEHERALTINPQLAQAHINLISLYGRTGDFAKAEKHYREAVAINPNLADSHYNYGVLLAGQQRYTEASQAFLRSLQINPFNPEAHHNYAAMIEREGRLDEAADHYRRALENAPGHRMAHFHLGRILVNQGDLKSAIEHFLQTLSTEDEDTPRYRYALGATYVRAGDREQGISYIREALKGAQALGQTQLANIIQRDLRILEKSTEKP